MPPERRNSNDLSEMFHMRMAYISFLVFRGMLFRVVLTARHKTRRMHGGEKDRLAREALRDLRQGLRGEEREGEKGIRWS